MKVIVEKKKIVGTLSTLVGRFLLLDLEPVRSLVETRLKLNGQKDVLSFYAVDDEGFDCVITLHGDFVVIPASVVVETDVKHVLTEEEEAKLTIPVEQLSLVE